MNRSNIATEDSIRVDAGPQDVAETNHGMEDSALFALGDLILDETGPKQYRARIVLWILVYFAPKDGEAPLTPQVIATRAGFSSVHEVHKTIKALQKDGWIRIAPDGTIQVVVAKLKKTNANQHASSPQD
jgi:hypothetical protein